MKRLLQNVLRQSATSAIAVICIVSATLSGASAQSDGINLVRDTEIENTIRVYAAPIFDAADLDPSAVRIHLVNSSVLNAFVANGQRIFVHTGLLLRAENAGQVIGVLAHEVGHITGGHLARFRDGIDSAQTSAIAGLLLGIPAAIATGRADIAIAASALGQHVGQRQFLQYTRGMEQSADQAATTYLDRAGISASGFEEFLKILLEQDKLYSGETNAYTRTHPLSQDRIDFIENHLKSSTAAHSPLNKTYTRLHDRMRAKIAGYTLSPGEVATRYPPEDTSIPAYYAHAMSLMQQSHAKEALKYIDLLLEREPENPFFHELKGDILRDSGRLEESLEPYRKAVEILPWAALIRLSLARSLVDLNNVEYEDEAEKNLNEALRYEPWLTGGWRVLGTIYSRRNDTGNLALAQAEETIRTRRADAAKVHAKRAMEILPEGSPGWLRAQDILVQASKGQIVDEAE
ncbi:MAG: M48 family metalloprotease [Alphaproteobacteria bacterium]